MIEAIENNRAQNTLGDDYIDNLLNNIFLEHSTNSFSFLGSPELGDLGMDFGTEDDDDMLKFMVWNCSGLLNNVDRLVRFMRREKIHVAFITETWLHPDRHIPSICEFVAVCQDTSNISRGRNGVAVIINPSHRNHPSLKNISWSL